MRYFLSAIAVLAFSSAQASISGVSNLMELTCEQTVYDGSTPVPDYHFFGQASRSTPGEVAISSNNFHENVADLETNADMLYNEYVSTPDMLDLDLYTREETYEITTDPFGALASATGRDTLGFHLDAPGTIAISMSRINYFFYSYLNLQPTTDRFEISVNLDGNVLALNPPDIGFDYFGALGSGDHELRFYCLSRSMGGGTLWPYTSMLTDISFLAHVQVLSSPVPEPSSLLVLGGAALVGLRRRRAQKRDN